MRSQQKTEKVKGTIKRKQRPWVKSHRIEDTFAILLQNSLILEMCSLLSD